MPSRNLTVVFTDIENFEARSRSLSRESVLALLQKHEELLLPVVVHYGGTVVRTLGDSFLLVFESPTSAVLAGVIMQERLAEYNASATDDTRIRIRITMHSGEVETIEQGGQIRDVYGDSVQIASRIEAIVDFGQVYFTESTYLAMKSGEVPSSKVDEFKLQGVPEPIKVYRVIREKSNAKYRQLVESQSAPSDEVSGQTGVFSVGLLYSREEKESVSPAKGLGWYIIGAAALLIAASLVFVGIRTVSKMTTLSRVETLLEAKETEAALDLLAGLRSEDPTNEKIQELLSRAVTQDVVDLLEAGRTEEAEAELGRYQSLYPHLPVFRDLTRRSRLRKVMLMRDGHNATTLMSELLREYKDATDIPSDCMDGALDDRKFSPGMGLFCGRRLVSLDPSKVDDPRLVELAKLFLLRAQPSWRGPDDHQTTTSQKSREFIGNNLYAKIRPHVREVLESPASYERWNALLLIEQANEDVDLHRFMALDLLHGNTGVGNPAKRREKYFADRLEKEGAEKIRSDIDAAALNSIADTALTTAYHSPQTIELIAKIYAPVLEENLKAWALDSTKPRRRKNSFKILTVAGTLPAEVATKYHVANLALDWSSSTKELNEAIAHLKAANPAHGKPAIPRLEELKGGVAQQYDRLKSHPKRGAGGYVDSQLAESRERLNALNAALRNLRRG